MLTDATQACSSSARPATVTSKLPVPDRSQTPRRPPTHLRPTELAELRYQDLSATSPPDPSYTVAYVDDTLRSLWRTRDRPPSKWSALPKMARLHLTWGRTGLSSATTLQRTCPQRGRESKKGDIEETP